MKKKRIVVAMSGGVDSSVTAALLKEQGHEVIGITLRLYNASPMSCKLRTCCASRDIDDARKVAWSIGIPHFVKDFEELFQKEVIDDFIQNYISGMTPNPCVKCNQSIKFDHLLSIAKDLDADILATGHYARIEETDGDYSLYQGDDLNRDQSYFLFAIKKEDLSHIWFPLNQFTKTQTRQHAERLNLNVAKKTDSQDICFIPNGDYAGFLQSERPDLLIDGNIVDVDGKVLKPHKGYIHYTIGQRKGLGIAAKNPLYVVDIQPESKNVVVGELEFLKKEFIFINNVNWLMATKPEVGKTLQADVKVRSRQTCKPAVIEVLENNMAKVTFETPEYGVAPGQACVFYENKRVLGGGWITHHSQY